MKTYLFKSFLVLVAFTALCTTFFSCTKDTVVFTQIEFTTENFCIDQPYLYFKHGESSKEITITYSKAWSYRMDEDWVHVTPDKGNNKLTVQVEKNTSKETRECTLTFFEPDSINNRVLRNLKISQETSLTTIKCDVMELNFSAYEGSFGILYVTSNGEWEVKSTPEWLRASDSRGKGGNAVSFKTLSANKTSTSRTGVIVIGTDDEEVKIPVRQYGEATPNCFMTPKHITVLSNGIAFDLDYSCAGNVAHYYIGYMEADRYGSLTHQEIISKLQRDDRHLPSDDIVASFSGLKPETEYLFYTLAFDMDGKKGDLMSTKIRTCKKEVNEPCGWISDIDCIGSSWEWSITMSAPCHSYWMMTTENPTIANASDALLAWWLEDAIRNHEITDYSNGGNWWQERKGSMLAVWTRGEDSRGKMSGVITRKSTTVSTTRSDTIQENNDKGYHCGSKLPPNQYKLYRAK